MWHYVWLTVTTLLVMAALAVVGFGCAMMVMCMNSNQCFP